MALRVVQVDIQAAKVPQNVSDFVVMIPRAVLPDEMFDPAGANNMQSDAGDLRAYSDAGLTTRLPLDVYLSEHDSSAGAGDAAFVAFTKLGTVSSAAATPIYLTYNEAGTESQPAVTDTYGRNAVWSDAELAVLAEDDSPVDRTGKHTLTVTATITNNDGGPLGKYNAFAGNTRLSNTSDTSLYSLPESYDFAVSALVRRASDAAGVAFAAWDGTDDILLNAFSSDVAADGAWVFWRDQGIFGAALSAGGVTTDNEWLGYDFVSRASNDVELYADGASVDTDAPASAHAAGPFSGFYIGGWSGGNNDFNGDIAKVVVWSAAKTTAYIAAQYANESDPGTFLVAGTPTNVGGGGGDTELIIADAIHAHAADSVALIEQEVLSIQDASHGHAADNVDLSLAAVLAVADASHGHSANSVALVQQALLAIADALHAHAAENIVLQSGNTLSIADALHAHSAESPTLSLAEVLAVADSVHMHTADTIALTQASVLIVSDALHAHLADRIGLQLPGFIPPKGRVFVVQTRHTTYVVARGKRTFNA